MRFILSHAINPMKSEKGRIFCKKIGICIGRENRMAWSNVNLKVEMGGNKKIPPEAGIFISCNP